MIDEISVFVPGHITGFFTICENSNPLQYGSRGVGLLIDSGVKTTVKLEPTLKSEYEIIINKMQKSENETIIKETIKQIQKNHPFKNNLKITQEIQTPIASGFGTSAASSLGLSIALKQLLKLPIKQEQAGQYAHLTEIHEGTGLGDVIGQTGKGIVQRTQPGAPGYGQITNIPTPENLYIITKTLNSIETKDIITNPQKQKQIKETGTKIEKQFNKEKTITNFLKCSYQFSKETQLIPEELEEIINKLNQKTYGSSMALIGNTAFAITDNIKNINTKKYQIHKLYTEGIKITIPW